MHSMQGKASHSMQGQIKEEYCDYLLQKVDAWLLDPRLSWPWSTLKQHHSSDIESWSVTCNTLQGLFSIDAQTSHVSNLLQAQKLKTCLELNLIAAMKMNRGHRECMRQDSWLMLHHEFFSLCLLHFIAREDWSVEDDRWHLTYFLWFKLRQCTQFSV